MQKIPVMLPKLPSFPQVANYLKEMDDARIYSNRGPLLTKLEKRLSDFFNVDEDLLVVCANATLALQGTAFLIPPRNFYVPTFTFPATLTSVINAGKNLQLCDVNPNDWTIASQDLVMDSNHTLIEVLPFGAPFESKKNSNWNFCIVDAAASTGSEALDLSNLKSNWAVVFSLHATKVLGIGEGGAVVFGSKAFADEFRTWINFGFSGSRESKIPGINGKMSEIAAAYGLATLDQWKIEKSEWNSAKETAINIAKKLGIESITSSYEGVSPYWIADFGNAETVKRVELALESKGIETRRWWGMGCHNMPAFSQWASGGFPISDIIAQRTLGLPMFRDLDSESFERIFLALSQVLEE